MSKVNIQIGYQKLHETELTKADLELVNNAKKAARDAYAPYSHFKVGAAVRLTDGSVYQGNNQENAAYPSGLCAERVALFYASAVKPHIPLESLVICALKNDTFNETPISPCGSCRQAINESSRRFDHPIRLILYGTETCYIFEDANALLPLSFDHKNL